MILVVGVAGSGKSTQAKILASGLGYDWVSVGQLLRLNLKGDLEDKMNTGSLIDDEVVKTVLLSKLQKLNNGYRVVLDGFPRRTNQATWLLELLKKSDNKIEAIIHLNASEDIVFDRLLSRGRQDDQKDAINERFLEYENEIKPLLSIFKSNGINVIDINGESTPAEVHKEIINKLKAAKKYVN